MNINETVTPGSIWELTKPPENWKDMKGYEGHYQISDRGRIRSLKKNKKIITPIKNRYPPFANQYHVVLWKGGKKKTVTLFRIYQDELSESNPEDFPYDR